MVTIQRRRAEFVFDLGRAQAVAGSFAHRKKYHLSIRLAESKPLYLRAMNRGGFVGLVVVPADQVSLFLSLELKKPL